MRRNFAKRQGHTETGPRNHVMVGPQVWALLAVMKLIPSITYTEDVY